VAADAKEPENLPADLSSQSRKWLPFASLWIRTIARGFEIFPVATDAVTTNPDLS
jgi:hypothetical protein